MRNLPQESATVDGLVRLNQAFLGNLVISPQQDTEFRDLFLKCDKEGFGTLDGDTARRLFRTAGLPDAALYDIWSLADIDDRGELDYRGFCLCCVLIAYCKMYPGVLKDPDWLWNPHLFHHLFASGLLAQCIPVFDRTVLDATGKPGAFAMSQAEWNSYHKLFLSMDHDGDGFVEGQDVRRYYKTRNELSDDELLRIWELADADVDGRLSLNEFVVMEHLVRVRLASAVGIPRQLPPELQLPPTYATSAPEQKGTALRDTVPHLVRNESGVSTTSTLRDPHSSRGHKKDAVNTGHFTGNGDSTGNADVIHPHSPRKLPTDTLTALVNVPSSTALVEVNRQMREHIESLKSHVQDLQVDMDKMERENAYLKSLYQVKDEHTGQLHALHSAYGTEAETERSYLRQEERELSELQEKLKALRREKLRLESEKQALREALRHSENATQTMMRSLNNEQNKVGSLRNERLHTMRKKIELLESMRTTGSDSDTEPASGLRAITDVGFLHDSKGIRVAASDSAMDRRITPLTSSYQHGDWPPKEGEGFPE